MYKTVLFAVVFTTTFSAGMALGTWINHSLVRTAAQISQNKSLVTAGPPTPVPVSDSLADTSDTSTSQLSTVPSPQATPAATPTLSSTPRSKVDAWILMYHYIGVPPDPKADALGYNLTITPADLDAQINLLRHLGYHPTTMTDLALQGGSSKTVALTFDDGYEDFFTDAWPVLKKYNWPATVYIITGKVGKPQYMTWDQIKFLHQAGIEFGAHTIHHIDLAAAPVEQQQLEINSSQKTLEQMLGAPVHSFAYPSGEYTPETMDLVRQSGMLTAVTTHSGRANPYYNPYELPRLRIYPQLTLTTFGRIIQGTST